MISKKTCIPCQGGIPRLEHKEINTLMTINTPKTSFNAFNARCNYVHFSKSSFVHVFVVFFQTCRLPCAR